MTEHRNSYTLKAQKLLSNPSLLPMINKKTLAAINYKGFFINGGERRIRWAGGDVTLTQQGF